MSRVLLFPFLTTLAACAPGAADRFDAGAQQLRADQLGTTVSVPVPEEIYRHAVTNDRQLFVAISEPDPHSQWDPAPEEVRCDDLEVLVYDHDATIPGHAWQPVQRIACPAALLDDPRDFELRIDVRDDLLAIGPFLYRHTASGWVYEARIGQDTPAEDPRTLTLLGDDQVAVERSGDVYVYGLVNGRWRNVQRIDLDRIIGMEASGDLLIVDHRSYSTDYSTTLGRTGDGTWTQIDTWIEGMTQGGFLSEDTGTRRIVSSWDGETLQTVAELQLSSESQWNRGYRPVMVSDDRLTVLGATTEVYSLDGTLIGFNDESPLPRPRGLLKRGYAWGDHSYVVHHVNGGDNLLWTHLQEPVVDVEVDHSFTQTYTASVGFDERVDFQVDVAAEIEDLVITMSGTGDADLYVRETTPPTTGDYDCAPYTIGSEESCSFEPRGAGTFHIAVIGFADASDVEIHVEAHDPYPH